MSDFIKKKAKDTIELPSKALSKTLSFLLKDVILEIMNELGVSKVTQAKMMNTGFNIIKKLGINDNKIKRDMLKQAIKKELNL